MVEGEDSLSIIPGILAENRFRRIVGPASGDALEAEAAPEITEATHTPEVLDEQCLAEFKPLPDYCTDLLGGISGVGALSCETSGCRLNPNSGEILIVRPDQVPAMMALRCKVWTADRSNVVNLRPFPSYMLPQGISPESAE